MSKGKMFVISGASGVGKSTVLKQVMDGRDDLKFSVSATTPPPPPAMLMSEGKKLQEPFLSLICLAPN